MTINGRRQFKSNTGKKYYVQDMHSQDKQKYPGKKYNLYLIDENDRWKLCYDPFWELLKFESIKDAQRYVLFNEICINISEF